MYKLVDCVFEDVGTRHQFVVPFTVVDTKYLHHEENIVGKKSRFTDNRYGQVTERIIEHNAKAQKKADGTVYSHRDDIREIQYISPLEPYIYSVTGKGSKNEEIKTLINTRFGTFLDSTVRLISMRIYDKYFADYEYNRNQVIYNPDALNWWTDVRDSFKLDESTFGHIPIFKNDDPNIIVEYHPKICSCNN